MAEPLLSVVTVPVVAPAVDDEPAAWPEASCVAAAVVTVPEALVPEPLLADPLPVWPVFAAALAGGCEAAVCWLGGGDGAAEF